MNSHSATQSHILKLLFHFSVGVCFSSGICINKLCLLPPAAIMLAMEALNTSTYTVYSH